MSIFEAIGVIGFISYISTYTLLQTGKLKSESLSYTWANIFSASMVLVSLTGNFNLASALIQVSWILISFIGIWRIASKRTDAMRYEHDDRHSDQVRLDHNLGQPVNFND